MRYDPIAAAVEGWGDDGSQPVHYDSVSHDEDEGADENQQAGHDEVAEAQQQEEEEEMVESQPVKEEEEDTQAEAPAEACEEETPLDNEEGQVTTGEQKKKCIWTTVVDALISEHGR